MQNRVLSVVLTVATVGAVIMYHGRAPAAEVDTPGIQQGVDGKEIYLKSCKECHGVLGAPTKASLRKYDKIPDFTDPAFFKTKKHEELLEAVEKGKGRDMKGFSEKLTKEEIKAVTLYVHTLEKKA